MKKMIFPSKILLVLCLLVLVNACQKQSSGSLSQKNESLSVQLNTWLDKKVTPNNSPQKARVESIKKDLNYSNAVTTSVPGDQTQSMMLIPLENGFESNINKEKHPRNSLLVFFTNGQINKINIVQYLPENGVDFATMPVNAAFKTFNNENHDANGTFAFLSIFDNFYYSVTYTHGVLTKQATTETRKSNTRGRLETTWCLEWWLITTTYYADGSSSTDSEYLYTTCTTCDPNALCDHLDDGSGGGGTYEMDNLSRSKDWYVATNSYGFWEVVSSEQFSGVRSLDPTVSSYFTAASHVASHILNHIPAPNQCTWTQFSGNTSIGSVNTNAMTTISGKVTDGAMNDVYISPGPKYWFFNDVF